MNAVSNDPRQVVQSALQYEAEGHKILIDARDEATSPLSRATFGFLADQELKHIEAIKSYAASLENTGDFDPDALAELSLEHAEHEIRGIFAQFREQFEEAATLETREDVYQVAEDMERRGYNFYSAAAEQLTGDSAKKLYAWLAGEETKHFTIIQETLEYIHQPDAIDALEERWMQF
jgi:rubrerythrin